MLFHSLLEVVENSNCKFWLNGKRPMKRSRGLGRTISYQSLYTYFTTLTYDSVSLLEMVYHCLHCLFVCFFPRAIIAISIGI